MKDYIKTYWPYLLAIIACLAGMLYFAFKGHDREESLSVEVSRLKEAEKEVSASRDSVVKLIEFEREASVKIQDSLALQLSQQKTEHTVTVRTIYKDSVREVITSDVQVVTELNAQLQRLKDSIAELEFESKEVVVHTDTLYKERTIEKVDSTYKKEVKEDKTEMRRAYVKAAGVYPFDRAPAIELGVEARLIGPLWAQVAMAHSGRNFKADYSGALGLKLQFAF
jgi:hypothetical protein